MWEQVRPAHRRGRAPHPPLRPPPPRRGSRPAESAGEQRSPGKGWVFTPSLKPAEEPPLGPWPESHFPKKVQVKMGQTEFVPW